MRKQVFGRRFKRDRNERKALFKSLISAMVINGKIKTTEEKAKAIKGDLEKLVTKAKKEKKELLRKYLKPFEVDKMINEIAPSFKNRNGGYTRIIKTGRRFNDKASMAILEWTEKIKIKNEEIKNKNEKKKSSEKSTRKIARASLTKTKRKTSLSSRRTTRKSSVAKAKEDK